MSIPWMSSIPAHWKISRAKNMFQKQNRAIKEEDDVVTCFRDGMVTLRKNRRTTGFTESTQWSGYQGVRKGDLVIHVMDAFAGSIGVSDSDGKSTPVYNVCTTKLDLNNYYYAYLLREMARAGFIQSLYRGIRERTSDFRFDVFAELFLPLPSREEQDQIVRYLDWKVSKINRLINVKHQKIALLQEHRRTVINHAITKGIKSTTKMKDSSYVWLGQIPEDWHIRAFSKVAKVCSNLVHPYEYLDMMQISPADIEKNTGRLLTCKTVRESGIISDNHRFYEGQIIYSKIRPMLNKVTIAPFDGLCSADMYPIETRLLEEYLVFFMLSDTFLSQLSMTGNRVKMPKINIDELSGILVLCPPDEDQGSVVDFLYQKTSIIDNLIDKIKHEIDLTNEYRNRLISDVVTGKMDVRDIVVPQYETEVECAISEEEYLSEETDYSEEEI